MAYSFAGQYGPASAADMNGRLIPNALITVRLLSTGALATLYSDRVKSSTVANPFKGFGSGHFMFWANPGVYSLQIPGGPTTQVVVAPDPADLPGGSVATSLAATQAGTIGAPTPTTLWQIQPVDPARGPFQLQLGGGAFSGVWDGVLNLGYNPDPGSGVPLAGEAACWFTIENNYNANGDGSVINIEWYMTAKDAGSRSGRPFSFTFNKANLTGTVATAIAGDNISLYSRDNATQWIQIVAGQLQMLRLAATASTFSMDSPTGSASQILLNEQGVLRGFFAVIAGGAACQLASGAGANDPTMRIFNNGGFSFNTNDNSGAFIIVPVANHNSQVVLSVRTANNANGSADTCQFQSNAGVAHIRITSCETGLAGSLVVGKAVLANAATDGFLYLPTVAGTPSGVPTAQAGTAATVYDTTAHKLWVYDSGWKGVALT